MKKCNKCLEVKAQTDFNSDSSKGDKLATICRKCKKQYRADNKEKTKISKRLWEKNNPEKMSIMKSVQYARRRVKNGIGRNNKLPTCPILKKEAKLARNRYQEWWKRILNVEYNIKKNIRIRLNKALKGSFKNSSAWISAGCSESFLRQHLISQFTGNMTWDSYGKTWELDHIIPLSFFDLTKESHIKISCHYSNLKPISRMDNIKKGNKIQDVAALLCVNAKLIGVQNEIY